MILMRFLLWFSCAKSCCSGIALCTRLSSVPLAERTAATGLTRTFPAGMFGWSSRISGTFKTCPQEWQLFYKIHEHTSIYLKYTWILMSKSMQMRRFCACRSCFSWFSSGLGRQLREYLDRSFAQEAGVWAGLMIYNIYIYRYLGAYGKPAGHSLCFSVKVLWSVCKRFCV